ncbi:MAG TPA: helix-turn-helix domain-containing protein [Nocardioidaceae bacterium]
MPVGSSEKQDGRRTTSAIDGRGPEGPGAEPVRDHEGSSEAAVAGRPVVVRRNAGVAALVGYAASGVAIAYLWRASQTMTVLDWALFAVMSVIAAIYLAALVDARTPLLVADDLGVRIRLGNEWRGLPWEAIGQVVVHPRKGLFKDGRLVFVPRSLARAVDGLDARARRHVAMNQKMYGAALAVPLGSTTRVSTDGHRAASARVSDVPSAGDPAPDAAAGDGSASPERRIAEGITALALGRAEVIVVEPESREEKARPTEETAGPETVADAAAEVPEDAETESPAGPEAREHGGQGNAPRSSRVVFPAVREEFPWSWARGETPRVSEPEPVEDGANSTPTTGEIRDRMSTTGPAAEGDPAPGVAPVVTRAPRSSGRSILGGIGTIISRVAKGRGQGQEGREEPPADPVSEEASPEGKEHIAAEPAPRDPVALRETRPALRAEATLDAAPAAGNAAIDPSVRGNGADQALPEGRELRRPGSVDLVFERVEVEDRVRPISTLGDPVDPLVIDDYVTEPAYDPVIGPELTAARTRLGLSVDELAERTRIRPHVIESIEVDDFAPCGGDFYARGHLRTLARILGKDVEPLLERFEERYATAPINARRVFEAELATGMTGSMRSTIGGPSWGLLIGVVLCLVLVWGVLRLFTTEPSEVQAPVIHGAAVIVDGHAHSRSPGIS